MRRFRWPINLRNRSLVHLLAVVAACLAVAGCYSPRTPTARRWLDPFGWASKKKELGEQPEFQKQVNKDPFPSASQAGVPVKNEKKPGT